MRPEGLCCFRLSSSAFLRISYPVSCKYTTPPACTDCSHNSLPRPLTPAWLAVDETSREGERKVRAGSSRGFMPPRKTKNAAPNQRDTRHENGLAQPGKRVSKKQSNGQLDGQPNGKPLSAVPPPALPTTGLNQGLRFPRLAEPADNASQTVQEDDAAATEGTRRDRTASEDPLEGVGGDMTDNVHEAACAAPSAEAHQSHTSPCGSSTPPTGTPPTSVSTILTYYPLRDAISILILLLSLPPTLVLVIQSLFASLTFVPPTAGLSISTWPNIKEMFNASNFGYPAMATILIVDFIFWAFWLPLWKPVQNIFLDFSQAVIAVSLSGAAASTGGPTYSIATSTLVVCVVHVLRYKAIHLTALDYLRSVIHKMDLGVQLDVPPFASSFFSPPPIERGWPFTVIRTILGIHIVSQGVTTCIRRSLVKANERDQGLPAITKSDPEAASGAEPTSRSGTISEGSQLPHTASATDLRSPGPSPAEREGKARDWSSKKKKKQANQVRSQQPLWAAVASTKVTFVKEMEQRDAADDARDSAAMYTNRTPVFISTIYPTTSRLWISEVRDTEIYFSIGLSPEAAAQSAQRGEQDVSPNNPGIDKSKPFFVRINGAAWSSTRIMSSATGDDVEGKPSFDGEIFGLAPGAITCARSSELLLAMCFALSALRLRHHHPLRKLPPPRHSLSTRLPGRLRQLLPSSSQSYRRKASSTMFATVHAKSSETKEARCPTSVKKSTRSKLSLNLPV